MDETPVKAGRVAPGKMRQAYFWPVYGEDDEIVLHYAPTREHRHVDAFLGGFDGKLLTDGYKAYASYARRHDVVHAQCWSHTRRLYEQAKESDPDAAASALAPIGGLYSIERDIRRARVEGAAKRAIRESQSAPIAKEFFAWCRRQERECRVVVGATTESICDVLGPDERIAAKSFKRVYERPGRRGPIPYIHLFEGRTENLPINRAIVGPSSNQRGNMETARRLVRGRGISVVASETLFLGPVID